MDWDLARVNVIELSREQFKYSACIPIYQNALKLEKNRYQMTIVANILKFSWLYV